MEWFALLIPIFLLGIVYLLFKGTFTWWEYTLPISSTIIVILLMKLILTFGKTQDTEYWGSLVVRARYYEYWSTWVEQTCTRTYDCNCTTDKDNNTTCQTCTETYDCSYCNTNNAYWEAYDDAGNSWEISESYYNYLKQKWKSIPEFIDLNRSINTHWGCGKDGNAYEIKWDNKIESSESAITKHIYINPIQSAKSSFKFEDISNKEAKKLGLYKYPKFYDYYKQKVILGLDSLNYSETEKNNIETYYQYFNGYRGSRNKVKIFVCLYFNKPLSIVRKQQAYWDGGNQNELTICISLDKQQKLQWVQAFSFTNNKRVLVDLREDIMNLEIFQPYKIYEVIDHTIAKNQMYRDFKNDFNYLKVEFSTGNIIIIYIISFIISCLVCWFCLINEYGNESLNEYNIKEYWISFLNKLK